MVRRKVRVISKNHSLISHVHLKVDRVLDRDKGTMEEDGTNILETMHRDLLHLDKDGVLHLNNGHLLLHLRR
jgi:hypothetical protein